MFEIFELLYERLKTPEVKISACVVEVELHMVGQLKLLLLCQKKIKNIADLLVFVGCATQQLPFLKTQQDKMGFFNEQCNPICCVICFQVLNLVRNAMFNQRYLKLIFSVVV